MPRFGRLDEACLELIEKTVADRFPGAAVRVNQILWGKAGALVVHWAADDPAGGRHAGEFVFAAERLAYYQRGGRTPLPLVRQRLARWAEEAVAAGA